MDQDYEVNDMGSKGLHLALAHFCLDLRGTPKQDIGARDICTIQVHIGEPPQHALVRNAK